LFLIVLLLHVESPYGDISAIPAPGPSDLSTVGYGAGNIGKQLKRVCYNEWQSMSAAWLAQPFPASANHTRLGTLNSQ